MPIENRNLEAGTRLVARHKKQEHVCEVVQTDDGILYRTGGQDYNSPSSAGRAVTGGVAVNGWKFWSLEGDLKPAKAKTDKPTKKAPATKPSTKSAKKSAKAKSAPKAARNRDTYGCGVCGQEFATMKAATEHALTHTAA